MNIALGVANVVLIFGVFISGLYLGAQSYSDALINECQKVHNVYMCKVTAVPNNTPTPGEERK